MTQIKLQPDMEFAQELAEVGGDSVKKCYQCATCSVACPVAPANSPYPRKEMVWASWGMKEKLKGDIDLWLCHNCGNCSDLCPRGARPADVMSAARNMVYRELTEPSIVGKWMSSAKGLPMLFGIPAILFFVIWMIRASIVGSWFPTNEDGSIVFSTIYHILFVIDPLFMVTFFGSVFVLFKGSQKLIAGFKPEGTMLVVGKKKPWFMHLYDVITQEIITHKKFDDCDDQPESCKSCTECSLDKIKDNRKIGHRLLVASFVALATVTAIVAGAAWGGMIFPALKMPTPLDQLNPVKVLANIGALAMVVSLGILTIRRRKLDPQKETSSFHDWYLLGVIWVVAISGILSQLFRLMELAVPAYCVYYLHLVTVWMLFAYLPWSKLGHFVYRTVALTYVRMIGRK